VFILREVQTPEFTWRRNLAFPTKLILQIAAVLNSFAVPRQPRKIIDVRVYAANLSAWIKMGEYYADGYGGRRQPDIAAQLFSNAAARGNSQVSHFTLFSCSRATMLFIPFLSSTTLSCWTVFMVCLSVCYALQHKTKLDRLAILFQTRMTRMTILGPLSTGTGP